MATPLDEVFQKLMLFDRRLILILGSVWLKK